MKLRCLCRCFLLPLLLVLGFDVEALAIPRDPPAPRVRPAGPRGETLVARARRRRHHAQPAPRPKRPLKPAAKSESDEEAETPAAGTSGGPAPAPGPTDPNSLQRGGRVEFDGRLVQGQTAKSGAIYLFARQRSDLRSMVRERESYRREVLRTVYPDWNK